MKVTTYLPRLAAIGGVELHLLQVTHELARRGVEIDLNYTDSGDLADDFRLFCSSVVQGPSVRYGGPLPASVRRILGQVLSTARRRPDVLYANNFSELGWALGVKACARVPTVCHLHEAAPFRRSSVRFFGRHVRQFIVASEFMRDTWVARGLDRERVTTVPYGIELSAYPPESENERALNRAELGIPDNAFVVLYLGRLDSEKGVEVLLDAWAQLALSPEEARLLVVGSPSLHGDPAGYLRELQSRAPAGCLWLPMRRDVIGVMHAADVLVLPSVWEEPFGRVIIETMATGRPVVASRAGGIPEILTGRFAEFLFPRGDPRSLADRLRRLQDWRATRPELAAECIDHIAQRFTLEMTTDRIEEILRSTGRER